MRSPFALLIAASIVGCESPPSAVRGREGDRTRWCEHYAELMEQCKPPEKREVNLRVCRNAYQNEGEQSRFDREHAAYVRWLNKTILMQAECAAKAQDCEGFSRCHGLRAKR